MRVRQLIGNLAGRVIEMPFAEARACIDTGTACEPWREVPGLRLLDPLEAPPPGAEGAEPPEAVATRAAAPAKSIEPAKPLDRDKSARDTAAAAAARGRQRR